MQCAAEQPPIVRRQLALEVEPCLIKSKEIGPGNDRRVVKVQHRDGRRDFAPDHLLTKTAEQREMSVQVASSEQRTADCFWRPRRKLGCVHHDQIEFGASKQSRQAWQLCQ